MARNSSGSSSATTRLRPTAAWRAVAPSVTCLSVAWIPSSPGMRRMSMSRVGRARRIASMGMSV
jgi:hypothetical protein